MGEGGREGGEEGEGEGEKGGGERGGEIIELGTSKQAFSRYSLTSPHTYTQSSLTPTSPPPPFSSLPSPTSHPGGVPLWCQTADETGESGDEVVETAHLSKHCLLLRVQLKHTQHCPQDLTLDRHCCLC